MYCSNCGNKIEDNQIYCGNCGSAIATGHEYAGYWRRYGALMLDYLVIYIVFLVGLFVVMVGAIGASFSSDRSSGAGLLSLLYFPVFFVMVILYFALMESSGAQGSLGKMAVGMKVVDMGGNRISFGKAILRQIGKIVSILIIGIGFFMCGFTEKRQGLHDMIAGTLVVMKTPVYFIDPRAPGPRPANTPAPSQVF
jgi:uncharacterized RDD family membrane protein YckC